MLVDAEEEHMNGESQEVSSSAIQHDTEMDEG